MRNSNPELAVGKGKKQSHAESIKSQESESLVSYLWKQVKEELKKGRLLEILY